jgi:hypothetical protein
MNFAGFMDEVMPINGPLMLVPRSHKRGVLPGVVAHCDFSLMKPVAAGALVDHARACRNRAAEQPPPSDAGSGAPVRGLEDRRGSATGGELLFATR